MSRPQLKLTNSWVFSAFAFIGSIAVAAILLRDLQGPSAFLGAGVAAAFVAMYWLYAERTIEGSKEKSHLADSVYYLGFILTLVSLGASLAKPHGLDGIESITRNFAVGLVTTAIGLVGRIRLTQRASQVTLQDANGMQDQLASALVDMVQKVELGTYRLQDLFDRQSTHLEKTLGSGLARVNEHVSAIVNSGDALVTGLKAVTSNIPPQEESLQLRRAVESVASNLEIGGDTVKKYSKHLSDSFREPVELFGSISKAVDDAKLAAAGLANTFVTGKQTGDAFSTSVGQSADSAKRLVDALIAVDQKLAKYTVEGEKRMQESVARMVEATNAMQSFGSKLEEQIGRVGGVVGELTKSIESVNASLRPQDWNQANRAMLELATSISVTTVKMRECADRLGKITSIADEMARRRAS